MTCPTHEATAATGGSCCLHHSMTRERRPGDRELQEAAAPSRGETGGTRSLSEAQVFGGINGPVRSAVAFEYFRIAGTRDVLHGHSFQMRLTVSSGIPTASDTMRQPETKLPFGFTPTLRRTSMAN